LAANGASSGVSAAVVSSNGDIVEDIGFGFVERVESRVEETNGLFSSSHSSSVDQSNETSEDGSRGRSSRDSNKLSSNNNSVVVSEESNIGISSSVSVVLAGRREIGGVLEVRRNDGILVRGSREDEGETSSSSNTTTSIRSASNFGVSAFGSKSSSNSSNVRSNSGIRGIKSTLRGIISSSKVSNTIISRSDDDRNSLSSKSASFSVESFHGVGVVFESERS